MHINCAIKYYVPDEKGLEITLKGIFSSLAIGLTLVAFLPYIRSILRNEIKPHVFSWIIWGSTTFIVFLAQLQGGGGLGAWPIGISGLITLYVAFLAFTKKSDSSITKTDWCFLIIALSSLPLWYLTADPLWAVVILTFVDTLGFGPSFRKAYHRPYEENPVFYLVFALRNLLVVLALENYTLTTVLFPSVMVATCLSLSLLIVSRRYILSKSNK